MNPLKPIDRLRDAYITMQNCLADLNRKGGLGVEVHEWLAKIEANASDVYVATLAHPTELSMVDQSGCSGFDIGQAKALLEQAREEIRGLQRANTVLAAKVDTLSLVDRLLRSNPTTGFYALGEDIPNKIDRFLQEPRQPKEEPNG